LAHHSIRDAVVLRELPGSSQRGLRGDDDESIGNLGGFVGPAVIGWLKHRTGSYSAGLYFVGATLAVSAVVTLLLSGKAARPAMAHAEQDR
jgi:hypothetical protein